jgi:hypothetical protein
MLMFSWNQPVSGGRILKDDVVNEAVDIEGHAKELLDGNEATMAGPSQDKGKGKAEAPTSSSTGSTSADGGKKLPKWLSKLTKK